MSADRPPAAAPALEARVDDFLAAFGKPPREAARALLEPTDENIAAMLRKEDERLAIAAYVGQRMTALRNRPTPAAPAGAPLAPDATSLPAMIQMEATVVAAADDPDGVVAAHRLDAVAAAYPSLAAHLTWIGTLSAREGAVAAAAASIALPVHVAPPVEREATEPFIQLHDLRYGLERRLPARGTSTAGLRDAIVALRALGERP